MKLLRLTLMGLVALAPGSAETMVVEEIIAKVNGDIVLRSEYANFAREIASELARNDRLSEDEKRTQAAEREKNVLRDLIDERLLVQRGNEVGINVESQVLQQREQIMQRYNLETIDQFENWASEQTGMPVEDLMDRMREQFLSQAVLGQEVGGRIVITRDEIERYYNEHKDDFVRDEGVRLAEILVAREGLSEDEFEKKANEIHERVDRGEPFAEMARRLSDSEGSKEAGGDIGIFRRGSLMAEIEEKVFDKNPGYITELIPVQRGYLILKVVDRYREGLAELEEVEDEIRNILSAPKYGPAVREYLTALRQDAYIEIRPGYVDSAAAPGQDTSWTDPAKLAPVTTTREEVLEKKKKEASLVADPVGRRRQGQERTRTSPTSRRPSRIPNRRADLEAAVKETFVQDLEPDKRITSFFLVQAKEVRAKKTSGEPYLALTLSDRTGSVEAKMWDNVAEVVDGFERDDFIKIKAAVQVYRDKLQLIIHKLRRAEDGEVDLADFIPHTARNIDEMFAELTAIVDGFENPHLKALVKAFLDDPEFAERLKIAPAAKSLHHAFLGGLLEHIVSLLGLARRIAEHYDFLDADLLQTGVILHDLGKIEELTYDRSFGYSDSGQLLGHITIMLQWIDRKCAELPDFPRRLRSLVEHMVLSHHGRYEFGSPKLPMFPEALALSYIDDLDSKLESMRATVAAEGLIDSHWTRYNPSLERTLLNKERYLGLDEPKDERTAPAAPAPPSLPPPRPSRRRRRRRACSAPSCRPRWTCRKKG